MPPTIEVDSRWRLFGEEGWRLSILRDISLIESVLVYDDALKILFRDRPDGPRTEINFGLWDCYQDVLSAIEVRARDDASPSGWSPVKLAFARGAPDLTPVKLNGSKGDDILFGGLGADVLKGGRGNDILHGEGDGDEDNHWVGGDDRLLGGAGDDILFGYRGDDLLKGGSGDDVLTGGKGADIFHISLDRPAVANIPRGKPVDSNHDRVTDFEIGTDVVGLVAKHYSDSGLRLETLQRQIW